MMRLVKFCWNRWSDNVEDGKWQRRSRVEFDAGFLNYENIFAAEASSRATIRFTRFFFSKYSRLCNEFIWFL